MHVDEYRRNEHVFTTSLGQPVRNDWMNRRLYEISIVLGFEQHVTSYAFRHAVANALEYSGCACCCPPLAKLTSGSVGMAQIADVLGHANVNTTRVYLDRRM